MKIQDFWKNVKKDPVTGCWNWTRGKTQGGYGVIRRSKDFPINLFPGKKSVYTHRLAWALSIGPFPDVMDILHKCDNPSCCNPEHLFIGTHKDNMEDMASKGRAYPTFLHADNRGEKNGQAKLSNITVAQIKRLLKEGELTHAKIAKLFGVTPSAITMINTNKRWKENQS